MRSSLLLQQYLACLVRLTWMVCEIGGKWPHSLCFAECCFQDSFGHHEASLSSCIFSPSVSLWCNCTILLIQF